MVSERGTARGVGRLHSERGDLGEVSYELTRWGTVRGTLTADPALLAKHFHDRAHELEFLDGDRLKIVLEQYDGNTAYFVTDGILTSRRSGYD